MNEQEKRPAIREFFGAPRPVLHWRTLLIGGCIAFVGLLSVLAGDAGTGLVVAVLGAVYGLALPVRTRAAPGEPANEAQLVSVFQYPAAQERYRTRPSSEQVMRWLLEDISRIQQASAQRLGLDETTREPLCVVGPLYSERVDGVEPGLVLRRRVQGGYLYSTYRISVFQFADTHLGVYECTLNLLLDRIAAERTAELFYKDVVAVRMTTESTRQVLKGGESLERSMVFSLTVGSGEHIRIVIDDPAIGTGEQLRALGEAAVDNIRAMLRQYKTPPQEA